MSVARESVVELGLRDRGSSWAVVCFYLIAIGLIAGFSLPCYSFLNRLLGCVLFVVSTLPLVRYIRTGTGVPLIELPLASFAVYYCLPLLVEDIHPVYRCVLVPIPHLIDQVLLSSILYVLMLFVGYSLLQRSVSSRTVGLVKSELTKPALLIIAFSLIGINVAMQLTGISAGNSWNRVIQVVLSQDLGVAILAFLYYQGNLEKHERIASLGAIVLLTLIGVLTGMTQHAAQPVFVWILCRWVVKKQFPVVAVLLGIAFVLFFQPVKHEYRRRFWYGQVQDVSRVDKFLAYGEIIGDVWFSGNDATSESVTDKFKFAVSQRFSLLLFTQRYFELTPGVIPYKNGESIYYVIYGWVPRAIWPDKPAATMANKQFPVEYGIQHPKTLGASFGVGHVAEVHVNFGLIGYVPVCMLLGGLAFAPKYLYGSDSKNVGAVAIQVVAAVNLMFIGSTIGIAYGGLITQLLAQGGILYAGGAVFGRKR